MKRQRRDVVRDACCTSLDQDFRKPGAVTTKEKRITYIYGLGQGVRLNNTMRTHTIRVLYSIIRVYTFLRVCVLNV